MVDTMRAFGLADETPSAGFLVPLIETYGFDEIPRALGLVGTRHARGKVAIRMA